MMWIAKAKERGSALSIGAMRAGLIVVTVMIAAGGAAWSAPPGPSITTNVDDGFTLAAVGDLLSSTAEVVTPRNGALVRILQSADATVGNFEAPAIDLRDRGLQPIGGGPAWPLVAVPADFPKFLAGWGFDLVGFANNHTVDWGPDAARATVRRLDAAGIGSAGFGETRSGARAPAFFATPRGRVALVAFTASFTEGSAAMDAFGTTPAVPGVSALHVTPIDIVTSDQFAALRQIEAQHNTSAGRFAPPPSGDDLSFRGRRFRRGTTPDTVYQVNVDDRADILRNVRQADVRPASRLRA
jgi:hypothetical protein